MKVHSRDPGVPSKAFIGSALIRKWGEEHSGSLKLTLPTYYKLLNDSS